MGGAGGVGLYLACLTALLYGTVPLLHPLVDFKDLK
jgi:hypothetical protein